MVINTNCLRNSVIGGGVAAVSSLVGGGGRCVSQRVFISLETSFCGQQHHCIHGRRHRLPSGTKAQSVKPSGGSPDSDGTWEIRWKITRWQELIVHPLAKFSSYQVGSIFLHFLESTWLLLFHLWKCHDSWFSLQHHAWRSDHQVVLWLPLISFL